MTKPRTSPPPDPRAALAVWPALGVIGIALLDQHVDSWWGTVLLVAAALVLAALSGLFMTMGRSRPGDQRDTGATDPGATRLASLEPLRDLGTPRGDQGPRR